MGSTVQSDGYALRAQGLVKRFGALVAVDGLDLEVRRGTCLGLLGPNGAGKTTTIEMLEGLLEPDGGTVEVLGRSWKREARAIRERIGVQLQETRLEDKLTVVETLRLFASLYPRPRPLDEVLAVLGLEEKRRTRVGQLSGGQRQRLAVGCALIHHPELLFLDEPTTGLDPQARRRLWEVIETFRAEGGTVLLTTHYMDEAERLADELAIVDQGRVIARGSPAAIIASLGAASVVEVALEDEAWGSAQDGKLLDETRLAALPGVREVHKAPDALSLSVDDAGAAVAGLLALFAERGLEPRDLSVHRPTLEDVFVSLTGKHLRDA